jgi:hypothetical protein
MPENNHRDNSTRPGGVIRRRRFINRRNTILVAIGLVCAVVALVLVGLLARLGRFQEAIEVSIEHLEPGPDPLACPSLIQLCQLAGEFGQLRKLTRERGDLLNFTAAALQAPKTVGS